MKNKTIQILNRKGYSVFKPLCISPVTREKGGFAIKSFRLIISGVLLLFSTLLTADDLYLFDDRFQPAFNMNTTELILPDTTENVEDDSIVFVNYPAKPMLYSLILPGLGQYKNGDPLWKSAIFAGVEVASIVGWVQWNKQAEDIRKEYELFGDTHWSLYNWVWNTQLQPPNDWGTKFNIETPKDFIIDGTHSLQLHLTGYLAETFGEFISSDSLAQYPNWVIEYLDEISVLQDQHFYENIGKYDQFVGGWDDFEDRYILEKTVEDTIEIILMTPNKNDYNEDRARSNDLLTMANYAVTAIMFNHVISGIEAVLTNQRNARSKAEQSKTDVGLYYDPRNKYGIGGITVSYKW